MTEPHGGLTAQEASDLRAAEALIGEKDWRAVKPILQRLAAANRAEPRYRALLAFVLGQEAHAAGDVARARAEWDRALSLDPSLEAFGIRRRRSSLVERLFGRRAS